MVKMENYSRCQQIFRTEIMEHVASVIYVIDLSDFYLN